MNSLSWLSSFQFDKYQERLSNFRMLVNEIELENK